MFDPVLEQYAVMSGGEAAPPAPAATEFSMPTFDSDAVSRQVPVLVAGILLGSVGALFAFRMANIRFAFGANVGA